jgi:hypothetical protein
MTSAEKRPYLFVYDYGQGGLWGVMLARSQEEIEHHYPELAIVQERPRFMSDDDYAQILRQELHDIDGAPWGVLNVVLADRERD